MKKYVWNIAQALDRLLNAILGGTDKEFLSSRIYRYREKNKIAATLYVVLNTIDESHCEEAYLDAQVGFDPEDAIW